MTLEVGTQNKAVIMEPMALGDKAEQPFIKQTLECLRASAEGYDFLSCAL